MLNNYFRGAYAKQNPRHVKCTSSTHTHHLTPGARQEDSSDDARQSHLHLLGRRPGPRPGNALHCPVPSSSSPAPTAHDGKPAAADTLPYPYPRSQQQGERSSGGTARWWPGPAGSRAPAAVLCSAGVCG